jgi:hypothetical protein
VTVRFHKKSSRNKVRACDQLTHTHRTRSRAFCPHTRPSSRARLTLASQRLVELCLRGQHDIKVECGSRVAALQGELSRTCTRVRQMDTHTQRASCSDRCLNMPIHHRVRALAADELLNYIVRFLLLCLAAAAAGAHRVGAPSRVHCMTDTVTPWLCGLAVVALTTATVLSPVLDWKTNLLTALHPHTAHRQLACTAHQRGGDGGEGRSLLEQPPSGKENACRR